mmetsp:Transcript_24516/g.29957  ORF Transcript_24516/g.29957 Transcript_24516/m.29957 type:complete len:205 (+) Transcript_24516:324-938(+)
MATSTPIELEGGDLINKICERILNSSVDETRKKKGAKNSPRNQNDAYLTEQLSIFDREYNHLNEEISTKFQERERTNSAIETTDQKDIDIDILVLQTQLLQDTIGDFNRTITAEVSPWTRDMNINMPSLMNDSGIGSLIAVEYEAQRKLFDRIQVLASAVKQYQEIENFRPPKDIKEMADEIERMRNTIKYRVKALEAEQRTVS